ncbi:LysM peptidoglycan-binding domain-containing protein [Flavobacterium sp. RHBU_3]|uniref:LysM peptidoglycan-binding domain-containing protein n=1 Tax=Flavobacterium sp. RHBU_3 TaxID=3391184 RepID=UPI0039851474
MKYILAFAFSFSVFCSSAFGQDYKKHKVAKGETVTNIAQKYNVTTNDIFRLNPDAKNGVKLDTYLLIPNAPAKTLPAGTQVKESPTKVTNAVHTVAQGETMYSVAKKYGVSVAELEKANSTRVAGGLKQGEKLVVPVKGSGVAAQAKVAEKQIAKKQETAYMYHTVADGDTKYSIAKKYGMTVQLIEELNPEVKDTLPLGYRLKLAKNSVIAEAKKPAVADAVKPVADNRYKDYTVQAKETLYSLTKDTGLTDDELIKLNPALKDGVKEGMVIKVPAQNVAALNRSITDLGKNLKKQQDPKKLALLLPFNMYRLETDTVKAKLLRTDKFLNLTLDFYAGAMMAIDSAKTLGLPLNVAILDAKETPKTSDVVSLKGSVADANAIIGPFFQGNVESTAALFPNAVVISPLAKETGTAHDNLYYSIPSDETMRSALYNYLKSKGGNVVAVVSAKKVSSRTFIQTNYPDFKILDGAITGDGIKALLVKGKQNFVILDTESLGSITGVVKMLTEMQKDYSIQLAVPDKNDKYDNDEVALDKLAKLKLLYPSITRDVPNDREQLFARLYREKNGVNPSPYAVRGFDITFDVIVRLFQPEELKVVMTAKASEQVENKFVYTAENGGNYNYGVYIMQYNEGLNVTEAQ